MTNNNSINLIKKLDDINSIIIKEKMYKNTYYEKITSNNKTLHFNKNTRVTLEDAGINMSNIPYNYITYKNMPVTYNTLLNIFTSNKDMFKNTADIEK